MLRYKMTAFSLRKQKTYALEMVILLTEKNKKNEEKEGYRKGS